MAVCSGIHTKHINTACGKNVEAFNVEIGGTRSNHWASETCSMTQLANTGFRAKSRV